MNNRKNFTSVLSVMLCALLLSCQTKEERLIQEMGSIQETVSQKGDELDNEEWDILLREYEDLKGQTKNCEFTNEQMKELGRLESKISIAYTKRQAKDFGKNLNNFIDKASNYIEGLSKGVEESMQE